MAVLPGEAMKASYPTNCPLASLRLETHSPAMHAQLLEQVRSLPVREQVELVDEILEGLPVEEETNAGPNLSPAQITELERRLAEHLADPDSAIPWSEVKQGIKERFGFDI